VKGSEKIYKIWSVFVNIMPLFELVLNCWQKFWSRECHDIKLEVQLAGGKLVDWLHNLSLSNQHIKFQYLLFFYVYLSCAAC